MACAAAKAAYDQRWRSAPEQAQKNRLTARAQSVALSELKDRYPDEYRELYLAAKERRFAENGLVE